LETGVLRIVTPNTPVVHLADEAPWPKSDADDADRRVEEDKDYDKNEDEYGGEQEDESDESDIGKDIFLIDKDEVDDACIELLGGLVRYRTMLQQCPVLAARDTETSNAPLAAYR
jgi:hypothetical protein